MAQEPERLPGHWPRAGPLAAESQKSGHVSSASILSHSGVGLAKGDKTKKLKCFKSIMQTCPKLEIEDSVSLSATKREREGSREEGIQRKGPPGGDKPWMLTHPSYYKLSVKCR